MSRTLHRTLLWSTTWFAALAGALSPGCGCDIGIGIDDVDDDDPTPLENEACPLDPCRRNIDCASGAICAKEEGATIDDVGCCFSVLCSAQSDCEEDHWCAPTTGLCHPTSPCVAGTGEGCSGDELCRAFDEDSACVASPLGASACIIEPARAVLSAGDVATFEVLALDAAGGPWFSTTAIVDADIGDATVAGRSATLTVSTCPTPPCRGELTAKTGGAECAASVVVLAPLGPDEFRASISDRLSHEPIAGVEVVLTRAGDASSLVVTTDDDGVAFFADVALDDVMAVSVFDDAHAWLTVIAPESADVSLTLAPLAVPPALLRGVKGGIGEVKSPMLGDLLMTYTGFAPRDGLVDVDLRRLFGPRVPRTVDIDGLTNGPDTMWFHAGQTFMLGFTSIKPRQFALAPLEETLLFTIGGKFRLADAGPFIEAYQDGEDEGFVLEGIVTGLMQTFAHGHAGVTPATTAPPAALLALDFVDDGLDLPAVDARAMTGFRRALDVETPLLPCRTPLARACAHAERVEGALTLVGFDVPSLGFVPTGMLSLVDEVVGSRDGFVGARIPEGGSVAADRSTYELWHAGPHDGLEGLPARAVVIARDGGVLFAEEDGPLSVLIERMTADVNDVAFSSEGFLALPRATFAAGVVEVEVSPDDRVEVVKVTLRDDDDAAWEIVSPDGRALDLGALRGGLPVQRAKRGHVVVVRLDDADATWSALVARGARGLARIDADAQAWARAPID